MDPRGANEIDPAETLEAASLGAPRTLVIACGALARELLDVVRLNRLSQIAVTCLPAILHNRPERITEAVRGKIRVNRHRYDRILCLYGDCGTGGQLDAMLAEEGVERIEGAHCYAFYTGLADFDGIMDEEAATFFLTDYLVRFFDRIIIEGLGLDRFPQLMGDYFGNYRRIIWLAQTPTPELEARAHAAAARLGLPLEIRTTGLSGIETFLARKAQCDTASHGDADHSVLA